KQRDLREQQEDEYCAYPFPGAGLEGDGIHARAVVHSGWAGSSGSEPAQLIGSTRPTGRLAPLKGDPHGDGRHRGGWTTPEDHHARGNNRYHTHVGGRSPPTCDCA
ncbi:MAG: hypothetical protein ACREOA_04900, partial [Candidatus Dormibacteria bacterium]